MVARFDNRTFLIATDNFEKHVSNSTVFTATDAPSAAAKMRNATPRFVMTDFELPKVKGAQFIDDILVNKNYSSLAIIVADHLPKNERCLV